jgi:4-amino-4-deoxy-L-arabinose transferase-like glycosyltransferase
VLTLAAGLRFAGIENLSLSHMDEGGYVSSAMTVATGGPYSFPYSQAFQSPPLLPWMIGALVWLTQAQWPILGVLISGAFGSGSVLLMFVLGRRWGGNQFGLWAATLLAASDFHIAYSRMVLTDVPLTFWFLLTLYCVTRMWEQTKLNSPLNGAGRADQKKKSSGKVSVPSSSYRWFQGVGWSVAVGLAAGAAWNTKYNGWLVLAIAATSAVLWAVSERFTKSSPLHQVGQPVTHTKLMLSGLLISIIIAAICFTPWYAFVERHFPGGYAAVSANHRRYFSSPVAWPGHAYSLIASLPALRHYGWIVTLGLVLGLGWRLISQATSPAAEPSRWRRAAVAIVVVIGLAVVVLVQGGDAALIFLGAAGIVPALLTRSWPRLLAAVWCGTFVVLTPLYHPYPRLMLPALPACIYLALWLLEDAWPGLMRQIEVKSLSASGVAGDPRQRRVTAGVSLAAAAGLALLWLLGPHPFGVASPSQGIWERWATRQSYRAAGEEILEHTDADAIVLCQTQLAMCAYCPRTPVVVEDHSFQTLFEGFPLERSCYLVVDFGWIHSTRESEALQGLLDYSENLTPLAIIPNDLCMVTLLDFLPPAEAAAKVADDLPLYQLGPNHQFPVPPPIAAPFRDVIVLYRVKLPNSR